MRRVLFCSAPRVGFFRRHSLSSKLFALAVAVIVESVFCDATQFFAPTLLVRQFDILRQLCVRYMCTYKDEKTILDPFRPHKAVNSKIGLASRYFVFVCFIYLPFPAGPFVGECLRYFWCAVYLCTRCMRQSPHCTENTYQGGVDTLEVGSVNWDKKCNSKDVSRVAQTARGACAHHTFGFRRNHDLSSMPESSCVFWLYLRAVLRSAFSRELDVHNPPSLFPAAPFERLIG